MIKIDFSTLNSSKSNVVTGEIYFNTSEVYFPHRRWNDFVVIVTSWWIEELYSFILNKTIKKIELSFMDGPMRIDVEKNEEEWLFYLIRDNQIKNTIKCIRQKEFLKSFMKEVNKLLRICKSNDWVNSDTEKLKKEYRKMIFNSPCRI